MRVVIAEANHIGHYFAYVRLVLDAVRLLTDEVTLLVTPDGLNSPEFATNLGSALHGVTVVDSLRAPRGGMVRGTLDVIGSVRNAVRSTRAEHLLIPTADFVAQAVGIASLVGYRPFSREVRAEGLIGRLSFAYPGAERKIPYWLLKAGLARSPWNRLHVIDLLAYQWLRNNAGDFANRFTLIPDPVEDFTPVSKEQARTALGLPTQGRYLVCPGILIYRKGIGLLLDAFLAAKTESSDRVLLAGPLGDDVAATLREPQFARLVRERRVMVIDKYLSVDEFWQVLCAGDVTVCSYPQQPHPSSIAIKSLACHRPVLGADSYWLGSMIPAFGMGWTTPVHDRAIFGRKIETALAQCTDWKRTALAERLIKFQSVDGFKSGWTRDLKTRLGIAVDDSWDEGSEIIAAAGLAGYGRV